MTIDKKDTRDIAESIAAALSIFIKADKINKAIYPSREEIAKVVQQTLDKWVEENDNR